MSGEVVEVNTALKDKPEAVNADPHGSWMIVLKLANPGETGALLDADAVRGPREVSQMRHLRPRAFQSRHIGPDAATDDMLKVVGASSLDALIDQAIPVAHPPAQPLDLPDGSLRAPIPPRARGDRRRRTSCSGRTSGSATTTASRRA